MAQQIRWFWLLCLLSLLAACGSAPKRPAASVPGRDGPPEAADIPSGMGDQPDLVPKVEPLSPYGNPKSYEVFGKTYETLSDAQGYKEIGLASWYGRKFHGRRTSSGEVYDMYKLSAAHKTLPLPSYVRVTNLKTGQSTIVRINDRGPFHSERIIDLSYAAALKLGMTGGVGTVELEAMVPGKALPPPPRALPMEPVAASAATYLQVAAYSDPINAVYLREEIAKLGVADISIRSGDINGEPVHRVLIGPFSDSQQMTATRERLIDSGLEAAPVRD